MTLFGVMVQGTLEGNQVVTHTLHLPAVTDLIKINQAVNLFKEVASHNASQPLIIESVLCFLPKRVSLYSVVLKDTKDKVNPIKNSQPVCLRPSPLFLYLSLEGLATLKAHSLISPMQKPPRGGECKLKELSLGVPFFQHPWFYICSSILKKNYQTVQNKV